MKKLIIGFMLGSLLVVPVGAQLSPQIFSTVQITSTANSALLVGCAVGSSTGCSGGVRAGLVDAVTLDVTGTAFGAAAIAGDLYSHVLLAIGFQNNNNPLNEPHQVGAYSAVVGNTHTGTGVTGSAATDGYVIGFETALGTAAGGATVPWAVSYSIGSVTEGPGDTVVRTIGLQSIDETAGTHNAFIAPYYTTFTGNWFVYYPGSRPSWLGEGDLTVGHEVYRSINDDYIRVSGGNGAGTGASLSLYGGAHASAANKAFLTASAGFTVTGATSITGNTAVTGTFSVTSDTTVGTEIYRSVNDSYSRISGGNGAGTGASLSLYGAAHASAANKVSLAGSGGITLTGATGITGNTIVTGTFSVTSDTTVGTEIYRSVNDSYSRISGGNGAGTGASLSLFGATHASDANKAFLTASGGFAITGATSVSSSLTAVSLKAQGAQNDPAYLYLFADAGDDLADRWTVQATAAGELYFQNASSTPGTTTFALGVNATSLYASTFNLAASTNGSTVMELTAMSASLPTDYVRLTTDTSGNFSVTFEGASARFRVPYLASSSGTRYVCSDTDGDLEDSTTACSGTDALLIASIPQAQEAITWLTAQVARLERELAALRGTK